jgi:hypothetical protein
VNGSKYVNPILSSATLAPATSAQSLQNDHGFGLLTVTCHDDCEINPLLRKRFPPWFKNHGPFGQSHIDDLRKLDWNSSKEKTAAYVRREANWRRMLVTQPPRVLGVPILPRRHLERASIQAKFPSKAGSRWVYYLALSKYT